MQMVALEQLVHVINSSSLYLTMLVNLNKLSNLFNVSMIRF